MNAHLYEYRALPNVRLLDLFPPGSAWLFRLDRDCPHTCNLFQFAKVLASLRMQRVVLLSLGLVLLEVRLTGFQKLLGIHASEKLG